ncbi:MAG: C40 family peptidase [Alphaproteobacteria bacterium]|nr:C40 family peptidase [Alphaproteobacteria bacterium]
MNEHTKQSIADHAAQEFPRECCGLLINDGGKEIYWPCRNMAVKTDNFQLHPQDYLAGEKRGQIMAIIHSHPNGSPEPSQADKVACERTGLPWHIIAYPTLQWASLLPSGYKAPLLGREWSHGVLDCYSLIRDWYFEERAVELMDFPRQDEWWRRGDNLYEENFERAGFMEVKDDLQLGDVILMQVLSDVPNHAGIYIGGNMMIHHLFNRLSCREIYDGYWRRHTRRILRFRGQA